MPYGLKYTATAKGISPNVWRVEFEEKNFTPANGSTPTQLTLVGDGLRIGYDREDDRFNLIYSRYAEISLKVTNTFNISTIQFDDERKYKIKIYKANILEFIGWLVPSFPSQEFEDSSIATFKIMAKDTLNQLKQIRFVNEKPTDITNKDSFTNLIAQCLRQTGIELNFEIYYNKYEDRMSKTINDCPLNQLTCDVTSFKESTGEYLNYYEVLEILLQQHDLKIIQAEGKWLIYSQIELFDGSIVGRTYNYLGVKITNKTVNTDKDIHTTGLKVLNNTQVRKDIPLQQVTAIYNVGDDENLLINGDLDTFSAGIPVNWNLSSNWNAGEISANTGGGIIINNTFLSRSGGISPETEIADSSLSSSKYIESDPIDISALSSFNLSAELYADSDIDTIRIRIEMIGSSTNTIQYYVNKYGKVVRSASSIYVDKGDIDTAKMLDISWKNESDDFDMEFVSTMKIRIYPGVRLRSGDPSRMMVKYKNIVLTGTPRFYDTDYVGRKWEYTNTNLPTSKKQEPFTIKFEDFGIFPSREKKHTSKLFLANKTSQTKDWKRTNETVNHSLVESMLIDRLAVSSKYGDIIEGSVFGYVSLFETLTIDSTNQRFVVLWSEYSLQNNQSEVYVTELYATSVNTSIKVYDLFENDKIVDVTSTEEVSTINVNDTFDKPITTNGGIIHGILYPDGGIDSLPKDTTNPRAGNKGILIFGGTNAEEITLGNKENQTLVDVLGGKIKVGYNLLYDKSITDGEGDIVKQLGLDSDFQVDGRIEAVSGISVGSDGILITKELGAGGKPFGQVDAQNELRFVSPVVNVTNVLGVNQITGINGLGVDVNAPFTFNQPIYVLPSNNPNSPITNAQFNTALSGGFAVSTTCKLLFVTNQTLSGAKTQGGYTTVTGDSILLNGQTTASENGIYVYDGTNWTRNTANDTSAEIRGKGHLILNGTYASTQWVNNNPADITLGTTAITYTQWSGAELDPIFTNHAAFNVTNAKIASWDLVSSYGTHLGLYVDLVSNQSNIGGAKKFTASVQSPIIKAGSDSLNITMFNYFGTAPRIASNSNLLDFFANTNFTWTTAGDLGRMKLNATGLRVGSTTDPLFKLHVSGTTGFEGLISVGNTSQGIAMSSGTTGQFLRRSNVSNGFYNVDVNRWENFGEFGQFQTHAQFGNISALPFGVSFVNGTTTNLPNGGLQAHVMKMSIGSEYPDQATYLAIPRPFANYFDGQIYVRGIYGTADSGWISVGGGNFKDYDFDEYEATIKYHGYFYNNTPEGREGFIGFNRLDGGVILEYKYTEIDSNVTTTYRNIMNSDGRLAYQIGNGEAKKYALFEEIGTGGVGVTYSPVEPIFFTGNTINVRTASATQNGVLTKENWTTFNNKQNTLLKASASQDGYLSKEDFSAFLANTGGGGTTYSFTEPLYLDGTVKVRVASALQNGVLTKEDWAIFNGKQNTLLKASATQDGYLSKEDFSAFLAGTGGGSGITYTFTDPIYLDGSAVKVRTASATQTGVLSSTKFVIFDDKLGEGSTVNTFLNFATNKPITFNLNSSTQEAEIRLYDINSNGSLDLVISTYGASSDIHLLAYNKTIIQSFIVPSDLSTMYTEVEIGNTVPHSTLKLNGTNFNFKTNTTPANGQKFLVQYDSSKNTFFFVPA